MNETTMNKQQKNSLRRFKRASAKLEAISIQKSSHGCGKFSAQAFDASGKLVLDWNL